MAKISILRGISGSGKSTLSAPLQAAGAVVVSSDHYFEEKGDYLEVFNPAELGAAHGQCFRRAIEACQAGKDLVVDNTNCSVVEVAPYVLLGQSFGAEIEIHRIDCDVEVAKARNTHGVPDHAIEGMAKALSEPPPPWYPEEIVHKAG